MADFASEIIWPQSGFAKFFYYDGWVLGFASALLIVGAVVLLFQRPAPGYFTRTIEGLAIVMLIASTLGLAVYFAQLWVNEVEVKFLVEMSIEEAQISTYFGIYYVLQIAVMIAPQLFWWRRSRRSGVVMLIVAMTVTTGLWFERVVIKITESQQEFLPQSWERHY